MSAAASSTDDLQQAVEARLSQTGVLRVAVPIVLRRDQGTNTQRPTADIAAEIEQAVGNQGLCLAVQPPVPRRVTEGLELVFVEEAELTVTILEQPALNGLAADAYSLMDDVMQGLHWQLFPMLSHPLQLRPSEPVTIESNAATRVVSVHFLATYGFAED